MGQIDPAAAAAPPARGAAPGPAGGRLTPLPPRPAGGGGGAGGAADPPSLDDAPLPDLVMFTPLPPRPNGIADYAFELLGSLARACRCAVVVADGDTDAYAPAGVEVLQAVQYQARAVEFARRLHIYHLGNNPDHVYALPFLAARPGLVVVHDPALHHLLDCASVALGDRAGYAAALATEYGQAGEVLGKQFLDYNLREQRMYFDMPMLRGLLGPARGVVVHSRFAAAKVLAQVPDATVHVVPHQFSPPDPETLTPRAAVRQALGVSEDEVLFVSLGFVGRNKLIDAALRALAAIRPSLPPFRYVVAGELRPQEYDVVGLAAALGLSDALITPGYVAEVDFFALIGTADVVINLRQPVGGETSGTMIRALGSGACLVLVDRGAFSEVADAAAVKLPLGPGFEDRLAAALLRLAQDPDLRRRIGAAARATTRATHAIGHTLAGYRAAILSAAAAPPRDWASPCVWLDLPPAELAGTAALADLATPLCFAAGSVPLSEGPCRVLALGDDLPEPERLAALLGQPVRRAGLDELQGGRIAPRGFDLLLICASAATLPADPAALLAAANRALAWGGMLVINLARKTPPGGGGEHHPLEAREAGARALARCGFRVEHSTTTRPAWLTAAAPAAEERSWRAAKCSEFITLAARTGA